MKYSSGATQLESVLLWTTLGLMGFGWVMVYSASGVYAYHTHGSTTHLLARQGIALALGLAALLAAREIPYEYWQRYSKGFLLVALVLLAAVLVLGTRINGAIRWFRIYGFSFQPSEVARFALVVHLAALLARKGDQIQSFVAGFVPALLTTAVFCVLIMAQPDLGAAVTMALLTVLMVFVGGGRLRYLAAFLPIGAAGLALLIWQAPYRLARLMAFLHPEEYAETTGYHLIQSLLAIGSGGPWGLGLGLSRQKLGFIPEAHTDFILAIIGEELGLLGVVGLILGYAIFLGCGFRVAARCTDPFGSHLAAGITLAIALNASINMSVVAGLLPTKGLVLPFISYGGSALIISALFAGVLMNVARRADETGGDR